MEPTLSPTGVLDKCVAVLDALAAGPRSLAELVEATGLARATAHRLAAALEAHGLVRRGADGRYRLGLRLIALGQAASEELGLREIARPALEALRGATGESVQLYVRDGSGRICVDSLQSPHELRTIVPVGAVLPLDRGSAGRILAGDGAIGGESTSNRRQAAWVESVAERAPGVASVSAPVHGADGSVIAAVSVSGPIERTSTAPGRRYGESVAEAARAIERALAGQ